MPRGRFKVITVAESKTIGADDATTEFELPRANYLQSVSFRVINTNGATSNGGGASVGDSLEATGVFALTKGVTDVSLQADGTDV